MKFEKWAKGRPVGAKNTHGYLMVKAAWDAAISECKSVCQNERLGEICGESDQAYENAITHCISAIDKLSK